MEINQTNIDNVPIVSVSGRIDGTTSKDLETILNGLIDQNKSEIVLDLEEVGPTPLVKELGVDKSLTGLIINAASEAAKKAAAEKQITLAENLIKEQQKRSSR